MLSLNIKKPWALSFKIKNRLIKIKIVIVFICLNLYITIFQKNMLIKKKTHNILLFETILTGTILTSPFMP